MVKPEFGFTTGELRHFINQDCKAGTYVMVNQTTPRLGRIQ
jgi:hypothetical protein